MMKDLQILLSLFASCKLEDPKGSLKSTRSKLDDIGETLNKNTVSAFSTHRQQLQCATMHVFIAV